MALILVVPLVLLVMSLRTLGSGQASWGERLLVLVICVALPASLLLFDRLLERLRRRIDYFREVAEVRARLTAEGGGEGRREIELPRRLASRLDSIESQRLLRRREEAIRRSASAKGGDYGVARSDAVRQAARQLPNDQRLALEEALEGLASACPPAGAGQEAGQHGTLAVPGTDLTARYTVDEAARRIDVHALDTTKGTTSGGEAS